MHGTLTVRAPQRTGFKQQQQLQQQQQQQQLHEQHKQRQERLGTKKNLEYALERGDVISRHRYHRRDNYAQAAAEHLIGNQRTVCNSIRAYRARARYKGGEGR